MKLSGEPPVSAAGIWQTQPTGAAVVAGNLLVPRGSSCARIAYATTQSNVDEAPGRLSRLPREIEFYGHS